MLQIKKNLMDVLKILRFVLIFVLLCGLLYPVATTVLADILFPHQAQGNLVMMGKQAVGSRYIGQKFTDRMFLWGRPSACEYNLYMQNLDGEKIMPSGAKFIGPMTGSDNLALSNPALKTQEKEELDAWLKAHPYLKAKDIPADLLTQSGSGIDPDISPEAVRIQVKRISEATRLTPAEVQKIIDRHTTGKWLGLFGEAHVNVLAVNVDLFETVFQK